MSQGRLTIETRSWIKNITCIPSAQDSQIDDFALTHQKGLERLYFPTQSAPPRTQAPRLNTANPDASVSIVDDRCRPSKTLLEELRSQAREAHNRDTMEEDHHLHSSRSARFLNGRFRTHSSTKVKRHGETQPHGTSSMRRWQ